MFVRVELPTFDFNSFSETFYLNITLSNSAVEKFNLAMWIISSLR